MNISIWAIPIFICVMFFLCKYCHLLGFKLGLKIGVRESEKEVRKWIDECKKELEKVQKDKLEDE